MVYLNYIIGAVLCVSQINVVAGFNMPMSVKTHSPTASVIRATNNMMEGELIQAPRDIFLTGGITEDTCTDLAQSLIAYKNEYIDADNMAVDHLNLYIQSPGGSLLPTLALADEIKNYEIPIETYIRGYAASAATLLSVVGSKRYMYEHSILMIHGVKLSGAEVNSLPEVRDLSDNVKLFMDVIRHIYLENSNMTEEQLEYFFTKDKWMSAGEALSYGLIDKII
jgi:ATP-dependent Clp protease protease subunit